MRIQHGICPRPKSCAICVVSGVSSKWVGALRFTVFCRPLTKRQGGLIWCWFLMASSRRFGLVRSALQVRARSTIRPGPVRSGRHEALAAPLREEKVDSEGVKDRFYFPCSEFPLVRRFFSRSPCGRYCSIFHAMVDRVTAKKSAASRSDRGSGHRQGGQRHKREPEGEPGASHVQRKYAADLIMGILGSSFAVRTYCTNQTFDIYCSIRLG